MNTKKNIWVFHHYATPPTINGLTRPFNFAVKMNDWGYKTTVFSSSYLHYSDKNLINDNSPYVVEEHSDIHFVFVKTPSSAKNSIARIKNMFAFYRNLFRVAKGYSKKTVKPDIILASSPHMLTMIAGIKLAKIFNIPCICEIRDLWPEEIFTVGVAKEGSLIGKSLIGTEHWIYKKASALIFTKEGDTDYLKERRWTLEQGGDIDLIKCHYINNGVDLESYYQQIIDNQLDDEDLSDEKFNVVYTGTIRPINNVGNIIDTAKLLKSYEDIQFLIYGDGNQLEELRTRVVNEGLTNVKLKGYVDKKFIPFVLSKSSVNILNYSQKMYNWSRGNSSNKLFEYMASGKPIISTVKMGYCPIEKYRCGFSLEKDTPNELAENILRIYKMPKDEYNELGSNARIGAKDFDYNKLAAKLANLIDTLKS